MSLRGVATFLTLISIAIMAIGGRATAGSYSVSATASAGDLAFNNFPKSSYGPSLPAGGASVSSSSSLDVAGEFQSNVSASAGVNVGHHVVGLSVFPTIELHLDASATYTDQGAGDLCKVGAGASVSYSDQLSVSILPIDLVGLTSLTLLGGVEIHGTNRGDASVIGQYGTTAFSYTDIGNYDAVQMVPLAKIDEAELISAMTIPFGPVGHKMRRDFHTIGPLAAAASSVCELITCCRSAAVPSRPPRPMVSTAVLGTSISAPFSLIPS